jgi:hypothetical protein
VLQVLLPELSVRHVYPALEAAPQQVFGSTLSGENFQPMLPEPSRRNRTLRFTTVPLVEVPSGVVVKSVSAAWLEYTPKLHITSIADRASLGYLRLLG